MQRCRHAPLAAAEMSRQNEPPDMPYHAGLHLYRQRDVHARVYAMIRHVAIVDIDGTASERASCCCYACWR